MKKIVWLIFYLGLGSANAQLFAPTGATWKYITTGQNAPDSTQCKNYFEFEAVKDTVINSISAIKISKAEVKNGIKQAVTKNEYFYQTGKKVYFLNQLSGEFHLLFDFEAQIGDTIKVFNNQSFQYPFDNQTICGLKYFIYKINDVESITISGQALVKQKVANICPSDGIDTLTGCNLCWGFNNGQTLLEAELFEKIGVVKNFYSFMGNPSGIALVATGETGMIYYKDENFDYFQNQTGFCKTTSSISNEFKDDDIKAFFTNDAIKISDKNNQLGFNFMVIDVLGNSYSLNYEKLNQDEIVISISQLPSGIYILKYSSHLKLKLLKFNKL